jgi:hypothetical protein
VNVRSGVLVFEKLSRGILIAKTFLLPDMDYPKKGWVASGGLGLNLDMTDETKAYCKGLEHKDIGKPEFMFKDLQYGTYARFMEIQKVRQDLNII